MLRHGAVGQPHCRAKHGQKSKLTAGRKPLFGDPRCRCLCEAARENSKFPNVSLVRDELPYRLRQQSVLGEFGRIAMQTRDLRNILQRATELCANGLEARFAKVPEYQPERKPPDGACRGGAGRQIPGQFEQADANFLAGFAGLLGVVGRRTPRFRTH